MVELVYTSDLKSDAPRAYGFESRLWYLFGVGMFAIFAYNKETREYVHLDYVDVNDKEQALKTWKQENPKRLEVLNKSDKLKIIALSDGGGI